MRTIGNFKKDLINYINNYYAKSDEYEILKCNSDIFKQILDILSSDYENIYDNSLGLGICLDTLFGNKYDDIGKLIYLMHINKDKDSDSFKKLREEFLKYRNEIYRLSLENGEKLNDIKEDLELLEEDVKYAKKIVNYLKYNRLISNNNIHALPSLLGELGYDKTDIAIMIEKIFNRNKELYNRDKHGVKKQERYRIIDLLSLNGIEKFDYPLVKNPEGKINVANSILMILEKYEKDEDMDNYYAFLPVLDGERYSLEDFRYIFYKVLERLYDKLNDQISLFKDEEFMMDLDIKKVIRDDCVSLIRQYNLIRDYMDSEIKKYYEIKYGNLDQEEKTQDNVVVNNLKYLVSNAGNPYVISDFKDIDYEYIEEALNLIMDFKYGKNSPAKFKPVVDLSKICELRLPINQVRVIMESLGDNDYLVRGVFIKKEDNPKKKYDWLAKRSGTISDDSEGIEEQLIDYVNKNKRKWTR